VEVLQDPAKLAASGVVSPAVEKLHTENAKLQYQLNHLKRVRFIFKLINSFSNILVEINFSRHEG
jgi:hypothetical protein